MILLQLKPLAAWQTRRAIILVVAALFLFAHGCHRDDEDHELSVPIPHQSQAQE